MLKNNLYPFAAVVGQEEAKKGLAHCSGQRRAGGLLIGGAKGTAKSVLARSVQSLIGAQMDADVAAERNRGYAFLAALTWRLP